MLAKEAERVVRDSDPATVGIAMEEALRDTKAKKIVLGKMTRPA